MSCLIGQTLQYGVTRAQESEAVYTHMICEEISKIGFFCDSVACAHDPEKRKPVSAEPVKPDPMGGTAVDRFQPANRMFWNVPPWKGGTFISGIRQSRVRSMRRARGAPA